MAAAILITGANRGLGFEFASQYVADGWRVFAACRSPAAATKLQRLAQDTVGMTDAESVKNAATQLKDVAIDVLINSAVEWRLMAHRRRRSRNRQREFALRRTRRPAEALELASLQINSPPAPLEPGLRVL
jgi:NAD(P)-dependent dehydrogenase (short-subunit alcohol dehydrogenase family)